MVLFFTLATSVIAAMIFGLMPAIQASKPDVNGMLKEGGTLSRGSAGRRRIRALLIIFESALTLVLLAGAGMMTKSFFNLQKVDPGFEIGNLLVAPISITPAKYPEHSQRESFYRQLMERIQALPGAQSVGAISLLPLSGADRRLAISIDGRPPLAPGERIFANAREITPGYFRAMKIPILRGRNFDDRDTAPAPGVGIINETMASRLFPGEDPIGRRISLTATDDGPWITIVGVAGAVRQLALASEPIFEIYGPHSQDPRPEMTLLIRTAVNPTALIPAVVSEVHALDKEVPLDGLTTMEQVANRSIEHVRIIAILFGLFAGVALALALMGVFTFMSYSVAQRKHEIGVRMALGASRGHVLKIVIGQGMRLVGVGIVSGFAGGVLLGRVMSSLLYQVSPIDPLTFVSVSLILSLTALLATLISARRATKVDPLVALRCE
jgi:putative ABC transport system permease protein